MNSEKAIKFILILIVLHKHTLLKHTHKTFLFPHLKNRAKVYTLRSSLGVASRSHSFYSCSFSFSLPNFSGIETVKCRLLCCWHIKQPSTRQYNLPMIKSSWWNRWQHFKCLRVGGFQHTNNFKFKNYRIRCYC